MRDHGRTPDASQPVEMLYREASAWQAELQTVWTSAREMEVQRKIMGRNVKDAEADIARARDHISRLALDWPDAVEAIGLAAKHHLHRRQSALEIWQEVEAPKQRMESSSRQVVSIEADVALFDTNVAAIVDKLSPALAGDDAPNCTDEARRPAE